MQSCYFFNISSMSVILDLHKVVNINLKLCLKSLLRYLCCCKTFFFFFKKKEEILLRTVSLLPIETGWQRLPISAQEKRSGQDLLQLQFQSSAITSAITLMLFLVASLHLFLVFSSFFFNGWLELSLVNNVFYNGTHGSLCPWKILQIINPDFVFILVVAAVLIVVL